TDVGLAGRGGAQDVVSIKAAVTYKRIFPLWSMIGQTQDYTISAQTYLRNQPFSAQAARVGVRICP
ncbi:MAG TPA: pilus assembly protein, partial [Croceibacterium sp.]|nr:pilus assembly protein [Croceibacterium sp.]